MDDFEELEDILDSLGIDKDQVYKILLSDGSEIISEVLPFNIKTKKITAINPLKIFREHFIDEGLLMGSEILTLFDPGMENPIIEINRDLIMIMYKVDEDNLERYAYTIFEHYLPIKIEVSIDDSTKPKKNAKKTKKSIKTNIISFLEYKKKRSEGIF